jgi:light-regulated signal transduction histidine kinase (bacteriophytochrome)
MTLLGALISPSLAQTADLLNRKISSFLTESAESLVGKSIDVDVLNNLPIWYLSNLVEVKQSLPSLWNAAGTIMTFKGAFNVKEHQKDTSLNLVFEGSATPSKKQFLEFPHLAKLCNFDLSKIMKI